MMETKETKTAGGWFCSYCQRGVDPSEVTFRETHEVCGRMIANDEPPAVDIVTQRDSLLSVQKQLVEALEVAEGRLALLMAASLPESDHPGATQYVLDKARAAILAAKASS